MKFEMMYAGDKYENDGILIYIGLQELTAGRGANRSTKLAI